jgi:glycosyltransferase involved in cell wall biosynthesis
MTATNGTSTPPLRILQAAPVFEPSCGGVETAVREASVRLARRDGVEVEILTADASGSLAAKETLYGVAVTRVRAWPTDRDWLFAPRALTAIRPGSWDVVHVQCYQTMFSPMVMAAAARARIPYVVTFHGGGHSSRWRSRIRHHQLRIIRPLLARAAALIACADWEIDYYSQLLAIPEQRFVLVPNGGDLPPVAERPAAVDGTLLVSIGRLERYKGHQHAIAALPEVLRRVPDARLWVAGSGPYEAELRALAQRLGVGDRVDIRVIRDRSEYAAGLSAASLGLLFSEFESHPLAAVEALALGVPLLVADNSGLAELAQKGYATTIEPADGPVAHAEAIVAALSRPAVDRTPEIRSWDERVEQLVTLYRSVR